MSEHPAGPAPWEDSLSPAVEPELSAAPDEAESIPPEKAPLVNAIAVEFIGFWNRLISGENPKTSQPSPETFLNAFESALDAGDEVIFSKKRPVLAPGEMETVTLKAEVLAKIKEGELRFSIED